MWLVGLGLLIVGLFVMAVGAILFFTIILIPFAIIAAIIGVILLIAGGLAILIHPTHIEHHHHEYGTKYTQTASGDLKYCTRCGAPNAKQNIYCGNCGKKFLE